jgi:hypothetical protein
MEQGFNQKKKALRLESVWGSRCIDPRILDLDTSWRLAVSFKHRPLYLCKRGRFYQLGDRLGGPKSLSGLKGEVKILDITGTRTQTPRSSSQ